MKVEKRSLKDILDGTHSLVVPLFQRGYVWKESEWQQLWEDIVRTYELSRHRDTAQHFIGAVVFEQLPTTAGTMPRRQIIDGQQRMTTVQLILLALRDAVRSKDGESEIARDIDRYIFNTGAKVREEQDNYKVWPTTADQQAYAAIMSGKSSDREGVRFRRFTEVRSYFETKMKTWFDEETRDADSSVDVITELFDVVENRLVMAVIDLDGDDDSQEIFETLNALGTPLRASDLIKNHLFRLAANENRDLVAIYDHYWRQIDDDHEFWHKERSVGRAKRTELDIFLQYYLTLKLRHVVSADIIFRSFKDWWSESGIDSVPELLDDLFSYATLYRRFFTTDSTPTESRFFERIQTLEVGVVYPLVLWLYGNQQDQEERESCLETIESYLIRRAVCLLTTQNYNRMFVELMDSLPKKKKPTADWLRSRLRAGDARTSVWPDDKMIKEHLDSRPMYGYLRRDRLSMVLALINDHMNDKRSERIRIDSKLQIEHIMPQKWHGNWPLPKGPVAETTTVREGLIQTVGNLTILTGKMNSSLSNGPWAKKRKGLEAYSNLAINRELVALKAWDEESIRKRSLNIAKRVCEIWPR